jgi:hypothetical protein
MTGASAQSGWMDANQGSLAAEFARLRLRLTGAASSEAGETETDDVQAALPAPAPPAAIDVLASCFGLSAFERDILLLCAGVEMRADLARSCAEAAGAPTRTPVTFGLALARLEDPHWSAVTPMAPLRHWRLVEVDETAGLTSGRLRIDERILHYVAGLNYLDQRLQPLLRRQPVHAMAAGQQRVAETLVTTLQEADGPPPVVILTGDDLEGQADVAANVASELGLHLYALAADALPSNAAEREALGILWQREARLLNAALLVEGMDREGAKHVPGFVDRVGGLVFVAGKELPAPSRATRRVDVNKPEAPDRRTLWVHALGPAAARLNGSVDAIAAQFRLSAQSILTTGREIQQELAGSEQAEAVLWRACQRAGRARLDELAQRIDSPADWEALVLPPPQIATLHQIVAHVQHRLAVYHDWGFASRSTRGLGISVLFAGESGTGKTMAAEVLANELHLDLYRIDLSSVVSKYIGETEKNLRRVFDAAEDSGVVLLFDEADALFGKRSEVRDSHDRYANIEVSYLLQRMEAYRGLAILTTNMKASLDTAFQRRLRFVVQFPFPDLGQREAIWRAIFPVATPLENLDFAKLARAQMAGGNIRNIALNAAFLAAQACTPVRMGHLLHAAQSEASKRERPLSDAETKGWV